MLQEIIEKKPYLAWDIKDIKNISDLSSLEHILCYGDWGDVQEAERLIGIDKMKSLYEGLISKKRVNLRASTQNYFKNYFAKYS